MSFRRFIMFSVVLSAFSVVFSGCSSKSLKPKPKILELSDEPPICTRIQYRYRSNKLPLGKADDAFQKQALKDSKRVYEAIKFIEADECSPKGIRDLFQKPADCLKWKGPYIDQDLVQKYGAMSDQDFLPFTRCWQQPPPV